MLILRAARVSPFNASNAPVPLTGVANATGLSPAIVESVLDTLLQEGFVEKLNSPKSNDASYRITGPGFEHVEQVRANGSFEDW
jgi:DNA-binding IclR family transcriptional regulator